MNLDEVIAANLRRIREEKGISGGQLAKMLGVGRHIVYDYERPRPGQAQRAFQWGEIVHLCQVLDVTLFDLVLPPEGTAIPDLDQWAIGEKRIAGWAPVKGDTGDWVLTDYRAELSWTLFGIALTESDLKQLDVGGRRQEQRVVELIEKAVARLTEKREKK